MEKIVTDKIRNIYTRSWRNAYEIEYFTLFNQHFFAKYFLTLIDKKKIVEKDIKNNLDTSMKKKG